MCTGVIIEDLLEPLRGEIPFGYVTNFKVDSREVVICTDGMSGKDTATFDLETDVKSIGFYAEETLSHDRRILQVSTKQGEVYFALIELQNANRMMQKLANVRNPNNRLVCVRWIETDC